MRNKLYYVLGVFYVLIFVFILYINGVFTGRITSVSNLAINVVFLLIIGALFAVSFAGFARLNRAAEALVFAAEDMQSAYDASGNSNLWPTYRKKQDVFVDAELNGQFRKYQKRIQAHTNPRGAVMETCSLEEYINEDLLDKIGGTYFNSAISGTMTGLGILGTFLGLSLGMSAFSGSDIFTISDNIAPLLDGMKVAFHTSVYGIFFSIVFNFVYRSLMADAYEKLAFFHSVFRECAAPAAGTVDENSNAMLIYQANMANSLKTIMELMKERAEEQTKGLERIVELFMDKMGETMDADLGKLGRSLQQACAAQSVYARNFERLEESTRQLLESSRAMSETMDIALDRQRRLEKKLSDTCDELGSELYTFHQMRDMYEK